MYGDCIISCDKLVMLCSTHSIVGVQNYKQEQVQFTFIMPLFNAILSAIWETIMSEDKGIDLARVTFRNQQS
jgi:hypothetical protein